MIIIRRKALEVVSGVRSNDAGLVAGNVDVTSHLDGREGRRNAEGEATMGVQHSIERIPARDGLTGHDSFTPSSQPGANLYHARIAPALLLLVPLGLDLAVTQAVFDTYRPAHTLGVPDHCGVLGIVGINHSLPSVHVTSVGDNLVVLPDVRNLHSSISGGACDQIDGKLLAAQVLLQKRKVGLGAIRADRFHNLSGSLDGLLHALADVDIAGAHTTRRLHDHRELELELFDGFTKVAAVAGGESGVLGDTKTGVSNSLLHQGLVTTSGGSSEVVVGSKTKKGGKDVGVIDHGLTEGEDAKEAQILLRLDGVEMVGTFGYAELLTEGGLVHLVNANLQQLLRSGVVHDILGAIVDVGVDDGNEESTLGGTLEKGEALSYARLEKDDGVLELRLAVGVPRNQYELHVQLFGESMTREMITIAATKCATTCMMKCRKYLFQYIFPSSKNRPRNCWHASPMTYNGLGLVCGNGIGHDLGGDDLVMLHFIAIVLERSRAHDGDCGLLLDELLGRNLVAEEGLVLEGLEILPLLDGDGRTGQLDGLGGRLDHGVRVRVVATEMMGHGCVGRRSK